MIGTVQYGGVELELTWCELDRKPVLSDDGTTMECVEYIFDVLTVYNPAATAYDAKNIRANNVPFKNNKSFAGSTDIALREYLSQPRRKLIVKYGDAAAEFPTFLESPRRGPSGDVPTDAKGGPFCDVMSIKEHFGTKTWLMHLRFRTYVACGDSPSPILSHRFRKTVDIDQDYYTTIITEGEVVFDVGRLWDAEQSPDFYRSQFFTAPPGNFKREHINVDISSDNSTAKYTVIDRSQAFNLGTSSPATRVEAHITTGYSQGSRINATASAVGNAGQAGINALQNISTDPIHDAGVAIGFIGNAAGGGVAAYNSVAPRYYVSATCRAWGSETSRRRDLLNLCFGIITARLGTPDFFSQSNTTEITVSQEITGKYVEVNMMLRWTQEAMVRIVRSIVPGQDPVGAWDGLLGSNGARFYRRFFPIVEAIPTLPVGPFGTATASLSQLPIGNRPPGAGVPNGTNVDGSPIPGPNLYTRGPGYLQKILVGALSGQCENPPIIGVRDPNIIRA
jgi:hypothetical protein